jgi:two-component system OmpR family sensor kinase
MGRLFWKFFFSYWAALVIGFTGVLAAAYFVRTADQGLEPSIEGGPRATMIVGSAAATLVHGGPDALLMLMEDWRRHGDATVLAVDASGREMLGRPIPPAALADAQSMTGGGRRADGARLVTAPSGATYLLFVPQRDRSLISRALRPGPPSPLVPIAAGAIASLLFGALAAWYVTRPIRDLRAAFGRLSQGDLETRVAPRMGRRRDEVADLGLHFDAMATRLQALMAARQSLLHDVSHELRSPLARLQVAIGLARQNPQRLEASLERIEQEAQRVDDLVAQVLTLSRLEARIADRSRDRLEQTDLVDLLASIAEDAHFEAQASGKAVRLEAAGEVTASARVELLHRAFENVLRNAVKFTAPGTTVDVIAGVDDGRRTFVVRVLDHGPGVPAGELDAIFQPFYRSAASPQGPGFGLGLAIARRAVEAHGGTVRASNREAGGLAVEIRVPAISGLTSSE